MEKEIVLEGNYGVVEVKNGKVVKKPKQGGEIYLNREMIAYYRMKERKDDIAICKYLECLVCEGRSSPTSTLMFRV